jgi:hypothetical protein
MVRRDRRNARTESTTTRALVLEGVPTSDSSPLKLEAARALPRIDVAASAGNLLCQSTSATR